MIVGTSALIAILRQEPEALEFSRILAAAERPQVSVANFVEAGVVVDGARNPIVSRELDDFIRLAGIGHPAKLNFGDCFAYALAKESGEALLYQGNAFAETGVSSARGE